MYWCFEIEWAETYGKIINKCSFINNKTYASCYICTRPSNEIIDNITYNVRGDISQPLHGTQTPLIETDENVLLNAFECDKYFKIATSV